MHQNEEDLNLCPQPRLMEPISHHVQNISQHSHVVPRVKLVTYLTVLVDIRQDLFKQVQSQVRIGREFVPQGPYHAV